MSLAHLIGWLVSLSIAFFGVVKPAAYVVQDTREYLQLAGVIERPVAADAPVVRGHLILSGGQAVGFMPCGEENTRNYAAWLGNTRAVRQALPAEGRRGVSGRRYVEVRGMVREITDQYAHVQRDRYQDQLDVAEILVMRDERYGDCRPGLQRYEGEVV